MYNAADPQETKLSFFEWTRTDEAKRFLQGVQPMDGGNPAQANGRARIVLVPRSNRLHAARRWLQRLFKKE